MVRCIDTKGGNNKLVRSEEQTINQANKQADRTNMQTDVNCHTTPPVVHNDVIFVLQTPHVALILPRGIIRVLKPVCSN